MAKNAIVGQSGGPTSVINASLAGVYDAQSSLAGVKREDTDAVLLPLFHTSLAAQITVTIDMQGDFIDAQALDFREDEVYTIIPSTVDSASRSGLSLYPQSLFPEA